MAGTRANRYVRIIAPWKHAVLLAWTGVAICGGLVAEHFAQRTRIDIHIPRGAEGYDAAARFGALFPETAVKVIALVTRADGGPVLGDDALCTFTRVLSDWARGVGLDSPEAVVGYHTFADRGLAQLAAPFVSDHADPKSSLASIIVLSLPTHTSEPASPLPASLAARARAAAPPALVVKLSGEPFFLRASLDGVTHDMRTVHPKVVPLAFVPLLSVLRSWRLATITLACILATAGGAFLAMHLVSYRVAISNYAPTMMLSATLATSIDYSLFLLARFREELPVGVATAADVERAVEVALRTAGGTVGVSGATLALCFFGLCFLPIAMISTLGLAGGVTIAISIIVNLVRPRVGPSEAAVDARARDSQPALVRARASDAGAAPPRARPVRVTAAGCMWASARPRPTARGRRRRRSRRSCRRSCLPRRALSRRPAGAARAARTSDRRARRAAGDARCAGSSSTASSAAAATERSPPSAAGPPPATVRPRGAPRRASSWRGAAFGRGSRPSPSGAVAGRSCARSACWSCRARTSWRACASRTRSRI
jgi:hypothetical protein